MVRIVNAVASRLIASKIYRPIPIIDASDMLSQVAFPAVGEALVFHRFAAGIVSEGKSTGRRSVPILQLRPTFKLSGRCARLPTSVMPVSRRVGSCLLGMISSPKPMWQFLPTMTSLSSIAAVDDATSTNYAVKEHDGIRTTAPSSTMTPGERTLRSTVP